MPKIIQNGTVFGSSPGTIADLSDTVITTPTNGQSLVYDGTASKWKNTTSSAGNVTYDNTSSGLTASTVQAAIDEIRCASYYGVCDTSASTANKEVTLVNGANFTLTAGVTVHIKFTNNNTALSPTLNVNGTGAKDMECNIPAEYAVFSRWTAGSVITFTYDGTYWQTADCNYATDIYYSGSLSGLSASTVQSAIDKVATQSNSTITINTTNVTSTQGNALTKKNGLVCLDYIFLCKALTDFKSKTWGTLPSGYIPTTAMRVAATMIPDYTSASGTTKVLMIEINTSGEIRCTSGGNYSDLGAPTANTQINIHTVYFV